MFQKISHLILIGIGFVLTMTGLVDSQEDTLPFNQNETEEITQLNVNHLTMLYTFREHTKQAIVSPDGQMLAVARQKFDNDSTVSVIDLSTMSTILDIEGRMDFFRSLIWSPDSTRLAIVSGRLILGSQETSIKLYSISQGPYILGDSDAWYTDYSDWNDGEFVLAEVVWNPSSTMIAVAFQNQINIYDGIQDVALTTLEIPDVIYIKWSANGKFIVIQAAEGVIQILGIASAEQEP